MEQRHGLEQRPSAYSPGRPEACAGQLEQRLEACGHRRMAWQLGLACVPAGAEHRLDGSPGMPAGGWAERLVDEPAVVDGEPVVEDGLAAEDELPDAASGVGEELDADDEEHRHMVVDDEPAEDELLVGGLVHRQMGGDPAEDELLVGDELVQDELQMGGLERKQLDEPAVEDEQPAEDGEPAAEDEPAVVDEPAVEDGEPAEDDGDDHLQSWMSNCSQSLIRAMDDEPVEDEHQMDGLEHS